MSKNKNEKLKIIPLGGQGEVGRNLNVFEYKGKILIVDMGLGFPEEDMHGIDLTIPNSAYLKGRKDDILGVFITHGHYDHIGAIPYTMPRLGFPPIYTGKLTKGIIQKRQEEHRNQPELEIHEVAPGDKIELGPFKLEPVHLNHNIPDNMGVLISTPVGNIFHTSDYKFDQAPVNEKPVDFKKLEKISKKGIKLLMCDSTEVYEDGQCLSESTIFKNLGKIFKKAEGRLIIGSFASLLNRIQQLITLSEEHGRKVVIEGRSMETNVEIARNLNKLDIGKNTLIDIKEAHRYPDSKLTFICTGTQGEERATFMRIANGEHKYIQTNENDTVVFSSSIVPGNARDVQFLKDEFFRQGADVYHYGMMDIHAAGHAYKEGTKKMIDIMDPEFHMPIYGHYSSLVINSRLGQEMGVPEENIEIVENGQVTLLGEDSFELTDKEVTSNLVLVDGAGIGDVGEVVLRDRRNLARDGMFVVIVVVNKDTAKVQGSPDIISRGFVYLKQSKGLLEQTRKKVRKITNKAAGSDKSINYDHIKDQLQNKISSFLYHKTKRNPMVLPVVIGV